MRTPEEEDNWYDSRRVGFNSRHDWDPNWYHKLGWPHVGADEWGRLTVTIGTGLTGYFWWAYRTCWKQCCHSMREQTYRLAMERWRERQDKLARGQCLCENLFVYRVRQAGAKVFGTCECQHSFEGHDEWGECTHVDESMRPTESDPPENLEIEG